MARGPERHYPNEAARRRAEALDERLKAACREDAPMWFYNQVLSELENRGDIDTPAGDYLVGAEVEDGELVATISKAERTQSSS
jgi:hypothetical protein